MTELFAERVAQMALSLQAQGTEGLVHSCPVQA